jgi:type I restriction enzyme S subunit
MKLNWQSKKIKDVAEVIGGGTPSTKIGTYWNGDIPWITPKDLSDNSSKYILQGKKSITQIGLKESSTKLLPKNSLLFSSRAPIGYLAINKCPVSTNQGFKSLVPKKGYLTEYLYYLFKKNIYYIKSYATGSTFEEISGTAVKNLEFLFPSLIEQKRISEILSLLDEKIELNQKMNQTLEGIAKRIFKSWFIDFDPIKAKVEGKPTNLSKEISDLFPDSFEDSEMGDLPKGWVVKKLNEITDFQNGYAFKSKEYVNKKEENNKEVFRMGYIDRGGNFKEDTSPVFSLDSSRGNEKKYCLSKKDLTIAMTDMKDKMVILGCCALIEEDNRFVLNQRVGRIRVKDNNLVDPVYLLIFMNHPTNVDSIRSRSNSGVQVNLSTDAIKETLILVPSKEIMNIFRDYTNNAYEKIFLNNSEIKTLTNLRDTILPKLISGELSITDTEKLIDEATA